MAIGDAGDGNGGGEVRTHQAVTTGPLLSVSFEAGNDEPIFAPGTVVAFYTITGVLGRGGMGVVYRAQQERPKRIVAIKVIRRSLGIRSVVRRFEHEADILGRLQHPGIAQIYEAGTALVLGVEHPYIAMELVEGAPLSAYASARNLGTRQRLELIAQVCDALSHAHQRGIIHRDLKPGNILVNADGEVKVLDFGVARAVHSDLALTTQRTAIGQLVGTLAYMSPEQASGDPADMDVRCDVYSIGVVMYELLTGRLPYDLSGRTIPEATRIIREESPERLSHSSRVFRGELETIVSKSIEKDRDRRYQSAAEVAEDVRRFLRGEPIHAKQDSAMYLLRKRIKRYRWVFAFAAAGFLVLSAFSAFAAWRARAEGALADAATAAHRQAESARGAADAARARLAEQLSITNIERGRLEAAAGNVPTAEDLLWGAYLDSPDSAAARWALWGMYARYPCLWTARGVEYPACSAVSPTGAFVLLAADDGQVTMYSGRDGTPLRTIGPIPGVPTAIDIAADNRRFALGAADGRTYVFELNGPSGPIAVLGEPAHTGGVSRVAFSPDGRWLATGGLDEVLRVWDTAAFSLVGSVGNLQGRVTAAAFSRDGSRVAFGTLGRRRDLEYQVHELPSLQKIAGATIVEAGVLRSLVFTRDRDEVLIGSHGREILRLDAKSNKVEKVRSELDGPVYALALANDNSRVFECASESVVPLDGSRAAVLLGRQRLAVRSAAWRGDDTVITVADDGVIRARLARTGTALRLIDGFQSWTFGVSTSPDGNRLAIGATDSPIVIIDLRTFDRLPPITMPEGFNRVRCVRFLSDSRRLVAGSWDGSIRLIDTETREVLAEMKEQRSEVYSLVVSPDESIVVAGHTDGTVRAWNLRTGAVVAEGQKMQRRVEGLAFSPDGGVLVAAGLESEIALLDPESLTELSRVQTSSMPWGVHFSPDGRTLAVTTFDGPVEVFDALSWERRATLVGHSRLVPAAAFSPKGDLLATGDERGVIRLWDTATYRHLVSLEPRSGEVVSLAFDPSGRYLAGATALRACAVYDLRAMDACIAGNEDYHRARLSAKKQ